MDNIKEETAHLNTAVSYWKKKALILPLLDARSPITGGVGGGLTLWTTSNKKLLPKLQQFLIGRKKS